MTAHPEHLLHYVRDLAPGTSAASASEAELLARFVRSRDEDAFAALVARHGPMVLGLCRRILYDADAAEDVAQATFLVLARRAATIRRAETLAAWLHRTARHLALNHLRSETRRRQRERQSCLSAAAPPRLDPLDELSVRELLAIFDEELQRLPERYRLPLILCCLEGRSQEEAARQLGWTPGSVKGRLERGRARLHGRLVRRGLTLSAALVALEASRSAAPAGFPAATARVALSASGASGAVAALAEHGIRCTTPAVTKAVLSLLLTVGVFTVGIAALLQPAKQAVPPPKVAVPSPAKQRPRTDRHGDPLPDGALTRLGTVRWRAVGDVQAVAVAPDGKTVATASTAGLCLFDTRGRLIKHIHPAGGFFERLAFSPDGKRLACCGEIQEGRVHKQAVQIWEVPAGRKVHQSDAEAVQWLGWSAGGGSFAVMLAKEAVLVRELATGEERRFAVANLPIPVRGLQVCDYLPAAKILAVADQHCVIHLWDVSSGQQRRTFPSKGRYVRSVALSPDGRLLAAVVRVDNDKWIVYVWDTASGRRTRTLAADQKYLSAVAFSPNSKTLATVGMTEVRFWDVATGRERTRTKGVDSFGHSVAFAPDGKTLVTAEESSGAVHLWDVASGALQRAPGGHTNPPSRIAFSADGRRVATGGEVDGTVYVWDPTTGEPLLRMHRRQWARGCAFSADGRSLFTAWTSDTLEFCDASTGRLLQTVKLDDPDRPDTKQSGLDMSLSEDRKTLVAISSYYPRKRGNAPELGLLLTGWDVATRKQLFRRRCRRDSGPVLSADLKMLADVQGGEGKDLSELFGGKPVLVEDLASGDRLLSLPEIEGPTRPLGFSPDGRLLATTNFGRVPGGRPDERGSMLRLWELASAREVLAFRTNGDPRIAFSPNRRLLALCAPSNEILLWDLRRGKELRRFKGVGAGVVSLAFAPDSRRLVSGLWNSTLLVWDVASLKPGKPGRLDGVGLARAWADLAADPRKAFAARGALAESPAQATALLKEHLKPVRPADAHRMQRLLADLESKSFAVREKAQRQLEELGDRASKAFKDALKRKPALEARRRLEALLQRLRPPIRQAKRLQRLRAVAVLEDIGSSEARQILEALAMGMPEARLTQQAKASLERLTRRISRESNRARP